MKEIPEEIGNAFYQRIRDYGLKFFINDSVRVTVEGALGEASVVGLIALEPKQKYLVEFSDGSDGVYEADFLESSK